MICKIVSVGAWNTSGNAIYVDDMEVTIVHDPAGTQGSSALTELDHYTANVESSMDYYAFGQIMPDRNYTPDAYRYGFNGQEKDDEVTELTGATNTAMFWEYDTRLGRRWNIDPSPRTWESVYSAFGDNPIWRVDVFGDRWKTKKDEEKAAELKKEYAKKQEEYEKEWDKHMKSLMSAEAKGDKAGIEEYSKKAENAASGIGDMKGAQMEIDAMGADKTIDFSFNPIDGSKGVALQQWEGDWSPQNADGHNQRGIIINYFERSPNGFLSKGSLSHEQRHAWQVMMGYATPKWGGAKTDFIQVSSAFQNEKDTYIRQFFTAPGSLQTWVKDYRQIDKKYIESLKNPTTNRQQYFFDPKDIGTMRFGSH